MPRRTHLVQPVEHRRAGVVETRQLAHRGVWQLALELAGGDAHRLHVEEYGRVVVDPPPSGARTRAVWPPRSAVLAEPVSSPGDKLPGRQRRS